MSTGRHDLRLEVGEWSKIMEGIRLHRHPFFIAGYRQKGLKNVYKYFESSLGEMVEGTTGRGAGHGDSSIGHI